MPPAVYLRFKLIACSNLDTNCIRESLAQRRCIQTTRFSQCTLAERIWSCQSRHNYCMPSRRWHHIHQLHGIISGRMWIYIYRIRHDRHRKTNPVLSSMCRSMLCYLWLQGCLMAYSIREVLHEACSRHQEGKEDDLECCLDWRYSTGCRTSAFFFQFLLHIVSHLNSGFAVVHIVSHF